MDLLLRFNPVDRLLSNLDFEVRNLATGETIPLQSLRIDLEAEGLPIVRGVLYQTGEEITFEGLAIRPWTAGTP